MKLLVAAHTPPPYHGQSFIVQQILEGLPGIRKTGDGPSIQCIHLNVRFSKEIGDIGGRPLQKALLLPKFMLQLLWIWLWQRPQAMYYVPAPGKRVAVYRDWFLLGTARALGIPLVFHWLAGGLADWVSKDANRVEKKISHLIYDRAALSIVPVRSELSCADFFEPIHTLVMPTGIPDPCPDFESRVMPSRLERLCRREEETPEQILFRAVFMAHCSEDKGLFDTMNGVLRANERLASRGSRVRVFLSVFGKFPTDEERQRYEKVSSVPEFEGLIEHTAFVTGEEKAKVFLEADVLLFPSYYAAEVIPTVILDALAWGLPVVSTKWRGIPELVPDCGLPLCEIQDPESVALRLLDALSFSAFAETREWFEQTFLEQKFLGRLAVAIQSVPTLCNRGKAKMP